MSAALSRIVLLARLTIEAWLGLAAFDVLRAGGFARLHSWLRRVPVHAPGRVTSSDAVWAVDEACVWYVRRAACLQRSVVATWLMRRHGVPATLVIGCRSLPFESHAWVEVDGAVVNDRAQYPRVFTVLDRI
jgi:Transglutaminase-like superfamily